MKLAIAQMVLGVLILVDCLSFGLLVSPVFLFVVPVLGLAVLGCGIAQFPKAKGLKGAKPV
ncbi:hypothetical protein ACFLWC_00795 [Chloroflexota bacterium]